jgi:hypothetical protein
MAAGIEMRGRADHPGIDRTQGVASGVDVTHWDHDFDVVSLRAVASMRHSLRSDCGWVILTTVQT